MVDLEHALPGKWAALHFGEVKVDTCDLSVPLEDARILWQR
jgi:hypothetical protein